MKKLFLFLATGLLFISLGCGGGGGSSPTAPPDNPPDNPPQTPENEWTVMIYIGGDNNLASAAIDDINELEQVGSTGKVHFTVLADIYQEQYGFFGTQIISIPDSSGYPITPMMVIGKHPEDGVQSHESDSQAVIYQNEGFNSADPNNLKMFIEWSVSRFPANNYALVIWNHGNGWLPGRQGSAIVSDDWENNGNSMNIEDVRSAIASTGIHFNILDFDACNMASVEVMYQLKDVTDYICSSQRTEPGEGNDYEAIANFLTSQPNLSAEDFGRKLVDSYIDFFSSDGRESVTRSLIRTNQLELLASSINQLSAKLVDPSIVSANELIARFSEPIRFLGEADLFNLLDVISVYYPEISYVVDDVKTAISNTVIYNRTFTGSGEEPTGSLGTRQFSGRQDIIVSGACGINIYLPEQFEYIQYRIDHYKQMQFNFSSHWGDVLDYTFWGKPFVPIVPAGWEAGIAWSTNVDLDLLVIEPVGNDYFVLSTPSDGSLGENGSMSSDSFWTGDSFEMFSSNYNVIDGPYFLLAGYYMPSLFESNAQCILALAGSSTSENVIISDPYYISAYEPYDPDLGPGIIYFGFLYFDHDVNDWFIIWSDLTFERITASRNSSLYPLNDQISINISQDEIEKYNQRGLEIAKDFSERAKMMK